jgi:UDP-glucose 4-epimerase
MKVVVTGCRGFLGGALGRAAAARGDQLLGLSRSAQPAPGWVGRHTYVDVVDGDLTSLIESFEPDVVVHAAGPSSVAQSFTAPAATLRAAVLSWTNVLEALRRCESPARAVLLSSAAVYGQPDVLPVAENAPRVPVSPYGFAKLACEVVAAEYVSCFGIDAMVTRLFSVVGPDQHRLLAWEVYQQVADAALEKVVLRGSPDSVRDFLHVDDAAEAILRLCELPNLPRRINVASGRATSVRDLAASVKAAAATTKDITFLDRRGIGDPDVWQADVELVGRLLPDWLPRSLDDAIADCVSAWSR